MNNQKFISKQEKNDVIYEFNKFNKAILETARKQVEFGFSIHWLKMASKAPVNTGWSSAPILNMEELHRAHEPGYNLGFRAGEYSVVDHNNVLVLDVDIKHEDFAEEAYVVANQLMEGNFNPTVISGSLIGRHQYLLVPKSQTPQIAAITLRQSDIAIKDGKKVPKGTEGSKPAWTIELLSTGKNVVMPPSIHPDTREQYRWANDIDMGELSRIPESILDWIAANKIQDWPEPEQLKFDLLPVDKFDAELLPLVIRDFVLDVAERTQCPVDFVAVVVIQMLCIIIGNSCSIRPKQKDDWCEYPNLWAAIVARPGQMKTPAKIKGSEPLRWLESDAQSQYELEMAFFENSKIDRELEIQRLKGIKNRSSEQQQELSSLLKEKHVEPSLRRYRSNDPTIEKLGELLNQNPRGIFVERDELIGLLASFEKSGHEADRAFYLEGWSGNGRFVVDRIGRGTTAVEHFTLSVFGSIQPAKLQSYLHQTQFGFGNDGLIQRFQLIVYPDVNPIWQLIDREPNQHALDTVIELARKLASTDWMTLGAQNEVNRPKPFFRFDQEAQDVFNNWFISLGEKVLNEDHAIIAEHLSKYRKLVPALSLVFHLVDLCTSSISTGTSIGVTSLNRAIAWSVYLESHARRIYHMALDVREDAVKSLAKKIEAGELTNGFTARDIYRKQWSNLNDPELVSAACTELEHANWIRRIKQDGPKSGAPKVRYEINPKICGKVKTNA